jgi:hypothetical protein
MALQLQVETPHGLTVPNAYAKISGFSGTKDYFIVHVDYYASAAARDAGTPVLMSHSFQWNTEDADLAVGDMYDHLKTLPDFAAAVDA